MLWAMEAIAVNVNLLAPLLLYLGRVKSWGKFCSRDRVVSVLRLGHVKVGS